MSEPASVPRPAASAARRRRRTVRRQPAPASRRARRPAAWRLWTAPVGDPARPRDRDWSASIIVELIGGGGRLDALPTRRRR